MSTDAQIPLPKGCNYKYTGRNGRLYGVRQYRRPFIDEKGNPQVHVSQTEVRMTPRPYRGKSERREVIKDRRERKLRTEICRDLALAS
jgi:hypothetical protein